jgi:hypothetical protein
VRAIRAGGSSCGGGGGGDGGSRAGAGTSTCIGSVVTASGETDAHASAACGAAGGRCGSGTGKTSRLVAMARHSRARLAVVIALVVAIVVAVVTIVIRRGPWRLRADAASIAPGDIRIRLGLPGVGASTQASAHASLASLRIYLMVRVGSSREAAR